MKPLHAITKQPNGRNVEVAYAYPSSSAAAFYRQSSNGCYFIQSETDDIRRRSELLAGPFDSIESANQFAEVRGWSKGRWSM